MALLNSYLTKGICFLTYHGARVMVLRIFDCALWKSLNFELRLNTIWPYWFHNTFICCESQLVTYYLNKLSNYFWVTSFSPFFNVKVTCLFVNSLTLIIHLLNHISMRFKWLFSSTDAMTGLLWELRIAVFAVSSAKVQVKTLSLVGKSTVNIR